MRRTGLRRAEASAPAPSRFGPFPRPAEGIGHAACFQLLFSCALLRLGRLTATLPARRRGDAGAGDAIAANTVMQMVDPWQYGVQDTELSVPADRSDRGRSSAPTPASAQHNKQARPDGQLMDQTAWQHTKIPQDHAGLDRQGVCQDTRAAFAASDVIQLVTVEKNVTELRGEIQEADCGAVIIDMDAAQARGDRGAAAHHAAA